MGNNFDFQPLQEALDKAKNLLVLVTANPSLDNVATGLACYLTFKNQGKNVAIACPTAMTVGFNRLIGVDKITDKIGSRNLVISFDYVKDAIEKVSYNIEDNKFNLIIEPKPHSPSLNPEKVSYSHSGATADIIFIIGATRLEDLEKFYFQEQKVFTDKLTINIDNKQQNTRFGKINFHDPHLSSCSEIVVDLIKGLNLPTGPDIATNLYAGIKTNSSNFQAINTTASTFEAAAWCLRNGAKKDYLVSAAPSQTVRMSGPLKPPLSQQFMAPEEKESNPPPDWLKPKIYKGKTLI